MNEVQQMAMRFIRQHLAYWRSAHGLPKSRAMHRGNVRYWISAFRRAGQ
jgi:hypothetical protein